jgi:hypothetical protein
MMGPMMPTAVLDDMSSSSAQWQDVMWRITLKLYISLFTLELIVMAAQAMIFKNSIVDYFKMFSSKVMIALAFGWGVTNANMIEGWVINGFSHTAQWVTGCSQQGGCNGATQSETIASACNANLKYQCPPPTPPNPDIEATFILWGCLYFMAADVSRLGDSAENIAIGWDWGLPFPPDPGNGVPGVAQAFLAGHKEFQLLCMAIGITCFAAAMSIWLTYQLLNFEMMIVCTLGLVFTAFQASKYTKPFSAGFPKYVFNTGVKFFVYYFVVAIISGWLNAINEEAPLTILSLVGGAVVPFGALAAVLLFGTTPAPMIAVVSAFMVQAIPGFAGSLLQGQGATSASQLWGQFNQSLSKGAKANQSAIESQQQGIDKLQRGGMQSPGGRPTSTPGGGVGASRPM